MKPENTKPDENVDQEANRLSPTGEVGLITDDVNGDVTTGEGSTMVNGANELITDDADAFQVGFDMNSTEMDCTGTDGVGADGVGADDIGSANAMRRQRHNIKEKERKEKIKLGMQEIQSLLPPSQVTDKRQTMHELLQLGIQHIRYLTDQNSQLSATSNGNSAELERLRKENEELKMESSRYRAFMTSSGLPVGVDPSHLIITWRYRQMEDINAPFLFAANGQQMAANMLPPQASAENTQPHAAPDMSQQQFSGQISYTNPDGSTTQYMMYTDLLNSSDPSCVGMTSNEQQNNYSTHGTSIMSHNGQLMFVSQPQMSMQPMPSVVSCQVNGNQNAGPQTPNFLPAANESTVDQKQLEESSDGGICQSDGSAESGGVAAITSDPSSNTVDSVEVEMLSQHNTCSETSNVQDASEPARTDESTLGGQEFCPAGISSVQLVATMSNSVLYSEGTTVTGNAFDMQNGSGTFSIAPSSSSSVVTTNSGADGQLQTGFGGQSVVLHNGQFLFVNQNQQPLASSINGSVVGPDLSGGFYQNANQSIAAGNMPIQGPVNPVFLNKPNQFGSQQVTFFPGQQPALPPALLQPPLASNQTVTVNTPQGPMIMQTLPSQPNEHPQALILPDGQIVPVVTQPNLIFPPQQCIPVTGSLLVPSVTPSRLGQSLISNAQNTLAAKLVDSKGQTFTLPSNQPMQLAPGLQPFSNIVPQVIASVDSSKLCQAAPLQAVPAQGHLPLPTLQPSSSTAKSFASRSKKKPAGPAVATAKSATLPHSQISTSYTAMVVGEGNILILPGNDIPQNPCQPSHAKPAQRTLMPKPMPKPDGVPHGLVPAPQTHVNAVPMVQPMPTQLAPSQINGGQLANPIMAPLTISLPNQPSLPFSCTPMSGTSTNSTDILAKATESLFTISPNNANPAGPEIYSANPADNQLQTDSLASVMPDNMLQKTELLKSQEKPKKSKKKKPPKSKPVNVVEQLATGLDEQQNLQLHLFSPGGRQEEEKESDINDFADLIRMEPPTPAPVAVTDVIESTAAISSADAENVTFVTTTPTSLPSVLPSASSSAESALANACTASSDSNASKTTTCETSNCQTVESVATTIGVDANQTGSQLVSCDGKVPKTSNNEGSETTVTNISKDIGTEDMNVVDAGKGKKSSPRKKKSHKADDSKKDSEIILQRGINDVTVSSVASTGLQESSADVKLQGKSSENKTTGLSQVVRSDDKEKKTSISLEGTNLNSPINAESVKPEKTHSSRKEKKKKDKTKTELPSGKEKSESISEVAPSAVVEPVEEQSGSKRGFALSNFLPAACKPFDAQRLDNLQSGKAIRKARSPEICVDMAEAEKQTVEPVQQIEEATQTIRKELKSRSQDDADSESRSRKKQKRSNDAAQKEMPEMLTFTTSDLYDLVDKVENMAAATQTEPKRKSHSRKHKSSCERDGLPSKKARKSCDKHDSTSSREKSEPTGKVQDKSVTDKEATKQQDSVLAEPKPSAMDIFTFNGDDDVNIFGNKSELSQADNSNSRKPYAAVTEKANTNDAEIQASKESNDSKSTEASLLLERKSKFSFFSPSTPASRPGVNMESDASKTSRCPTPTNDISLAAVPSSSAVLVSVPSTSISYVNTEPKSVASTVTATPCVSFSSYVPETSSKIVENSSAIVLDSLLGAKDSTTSSVDGSLGHVAGRAAGVPVTGVPVTGVAVTGVAVTGVAVTGVAVTSVAVTSVAVSSVVDKLSSTTSLKTSTAKARHTNIVSLAGSLTPKSGVTKLSAHAQRNKSERDGSKDTTNVTLDSDKCVKTKDTERRPDVPAVVVSTADKQHNPVVSQPVSKETVAKESVDTTTTLHSKHSKEKINHEKAPTSTSETLSAKDTYSQESMSTSNKNHYMTSPPVLSQCAYNDPYQKSHTPSSVNGLGGTVASDPCVSLASSRSGFNNTQKSSVVQTSSHQSSVQPKTGTRYASNGVEMERKSWQDESSMRLKEYFKPMDSPVLSCAVQNKNPALFSCSSGFPADKVGITHQQPDGMGFAGGNFGGLGQHPFYPQQSAFRGHEQMSPCGGGMSSCSVEKHSSTVKSGNQAADNASLRRDISKANHHDSYFAPPFIEPTVSPALGSMNRDKTACLGNSMSSQTSSRQSLANPASSASRSRSHNRSPAIPEQSNPYAAALSSYHGAATPGPLSTNMLHHPHSAVSDYGSRYPNNPYDMFQTPGSQINPNFSGLAFDPPQILRDCSSVSLQNNSNKKSTAKASDSGFDVAPKTTRSTTQQVSNQSQSSCKSNSNRSTSKASSSSSSKKSTKPPSSSYGMDSGMFESSCVTPFLSIGSLSPTRTDNLTYFPAPNLFGNAGRALSTAKTLQHREPALPLNPALFSPSRAAQNGFGLNFQPGFGMEHMHGTHMTSPQVMPPPPSANTMPAHMLGFGFGNVFPDISGASQRDALTMSPIKLGGGMEAGALHHHHHHHQGASSMYNGRGQLPAHMLPDMSFTPFLGHQHTGFDARSIGTPFASHGPGASFPMTALNFPMPNL